LDNVAFILWPFEIFYRYLGYFMTVWYIMCSFGTFLSGFGILFQEQSGNPEPNAFIVLDGVLSVEKGTV
jgi:hypothetical protein